MDLLNKPVKAVQYEKVEVDYRNTHYHTTSTIISIWTAPYKAFLASVVLSSSLIPFWSISTSYLATSGVIALLMASINVFYCIGMAIVYEDGMGGIRKHLKKINAPITKDEWKLDFHKSGFRVKQENLMSFYKAFFNPVRFFKPIALYRTTRYSTHNEEYTVITDYLASSKVFREVKVIPAEVTF